MAIWIPFLLGGAALVSAIIGIEEFREGKKRLRRAEAIRTKALSDYGGAVQALDEHRKRVFSSLQALGKKKFEIFMDAARELVKIIKKAKARAELPEYELTKLEVKQVEFEREMAQVGAVEVAFDAGKALVKAVLGAGGVYGAVGTFATASTGTAIASLSGAAATNATLAWLGGGSIAAGGFGMAAGTAILGGIVVGPALAILGSSYASRCEKEVTSAQKYAAEVEKALATISEIRARLDAIEENIRETSEVLGRLHDFFRRLKEQYDAAGRNEQETILTRMIAVYNAIKEVVQTPLWEADGMPAVGLNVRYQKLLEVAEMPTPASSS